MDFMKFFEKNLKFPNPKHPLDVFIYSLQNGNFDKHDGVFHIYTIRKWCLNPSLSSNGVHGIDE